MRKAIWLLVIFLFLAPPAWSETYNIDPAHSQIQFSVDHLMVFKVRGFFTDFDGTIEADEKNRKLLSVNANIRTKSVDTRIEKRDNHLRSADFFWADKYPNMTFVSKKLMVKGDNLVATGDLTIRGVTKEVEIVGSYLGKQVDPWGNERAGFQGTTKVNRKDFGLNWNQAIETGGVVVGDMVDITLEIQAIKGK